MPTRLRKLQVFEISLVDRPANQRPYLILKNAGAPAGGGAVSEGAIQAAADALKERARAGIWAIAQELLDQGEAPTFAQAVSKAVQTRAGAEFAGAYLGVRDITQPTVLRALLAGEAIVQKAAPAGPAAVRRYVPIVKADHERRIVYGVVAEPDVVDAHGDILTAADIEEAAHAYLATSRAVRVQHSGPAGAEVVESYIAPADFYLGGQHVRAGSWVIGVHVTDPELWAAIKRGDFTGFSVGGRAVREPA